MQPSGTTESAPDTDPRVAALVREVDARAAARPDAVHGDLVEEVALECDDVELAVELCRTTMRFVPDTVRARVFEAEHQEAFDRAAVQLAEREAAEARSKQRNSRAAATRAAAAAAEAAERSAEIRGATCPSCFQVRSASGVCGCD